MIVFLGFYKQAESNRKWGLSYKVRPCSIAFITPVLLPRLGGIKRERTLKTDNQVWNFSLKTFKITCFWKIFPQEQTLVNVPSNMLAVHAPEEKRNIPEAGKWVSLHPMTPHPGGWESPFHVQQILRGDAACPTRTLGWGSLSRSLEIPTLYSLATPQFVCLFVCICL